MDFITAGIVIYLVLGTVVSACSTIWVVSQVEGDTSFLIVAIYYITMVFMWLPFFVWATLVSLWRWVK